jgi:phosphopantetheinyl transferase
MPLVAITNTDQQAAWALWHISETESELAFLSMEALPEEIAAPQKRLEYLAGRALVRYLAEQAGLDYIGIHKDEYGKPFLKNLPHHISLSHSFPYVAAQLHPTQAVGIDLEQPKDKLLRIGPRVLAPQELSDAGTNVTKHCVYWCAKEAMYKVHGKRGLHFDKQLLVAPFTLQASGLLAGTIVAESPQKITLGYLVQPDYVLVYTSV